MFSCALQLDAASKGRQRKAAAAELDRAEARLAKYQHRISTGQSGDGLPKVRCLAVLVAAATRMSLQPHEWRCCEALSRRASRLQGRSRMREADCSCGRSCGCRSAWDLVCCRMSHRALSRPAALGMRPNGGMQ